MYIYFLKARGSLIPLSPLVINLFAPVAIVLELTLVSSRSLKDINFIEMLRHIVFT